MAKVYAPNQQYTGASASVTFVNGVGETDNPHLLQWFEDRGYIIERLEQEEKKEPEAPEKPNGKKPKGDK